jgi:hypothetical protein
MQSKLTTMKKMMQQRHTQRDYVLILLQVYWKGYYSFWGYCVREIQIFSCYYYLFFSFSHVLNILNILNIISISWWHWILTLYICLNFLVWVETMKTDEERQ